MDAPVTFTKTVSPICLPSAVDSGNDYAGNDSVVIGWGQTSWGSNTMLKILNVMGILKIRL